MTNTSLLLAVSGGFLGGIDPWIFGFSFITVAMTLWMGFRSVKTSKTASDFFAEPNRSN